MKQMLIQAYKHMKDNSCFILELILYISRYIQVKRGRNQMTTDEVSEVVAKHCGHSACSECVCCMHYSCELLCKTER